ncbi:hypothetical protein MAMC_00152 [Methylacidimicrobium cyclopophantes]|uniref:Nucleotidyltransferase family protein n=1 Tax=Methylacidimicrobium cyclopophantes TaxID=1041766 RepID=A0A5E6M8F4_9BACT|nr:nucleotidyltransferase family protein [Methylacidimicrobium cyclopophantes]VVM04626.1 hypothetical protein MAMC_00152 [Methylacidimicrobium cyclopophantes]
MMESGAGCGTPEPSGRKGCRNRRADAAEAKGKAVDALICALLREETPAWPWEGDESFTARFLERSAYHGVQALVYHLWQNRMGKAAELGWPKRVLDACHEQAIAKAMWELRHRKLLKRVVAAFSELGVQPIFFKGTALAYDLYPAPFLRTRADTDLLVPPRKRDPVIRVLESLGFARRPNVSGDFITYEAEFGWMAPVSHQEHLLDLHWRINNSELLAQLFPHEEVCAAAQGLSALNADAVAVSRVYALLLACMHQAVHKQAPYYVDDVSYYGGDRLIWLYDIDCLLGNLSLHQYWEFVELAERKGLRRTCQRSIERAISLFHAVVPEEAYRVLARQGSQKSADRYLEASSLYRFCADFRAIPGIPNKLRFLGELFFPPESYMRSKYAGRKRAWLPWLYLRRAGTGLRKKLRVRTP